MKIIEFSGHSDDTFGWDEYDARKKRLRGDDHDDCSKGKVRVFRVESPSTGAVLVSGAYHKCLTAVWTVGLAPVDEDVAMPEWATRPYFRTEGYTPVLTLTTPDDTTVTLESVDGDGVEPDPLMESP